LKAKGAAMETGLKLFLDGVTVLIVCIGISFLIYQTRMVTDTYDVIRNQIKEDELYPQYNQIDLEEISYAELIATLLDRLEYDIVVDGVLINHTEHDMDKISEYNLNQGMYLKEYQYDENGNIILITYTSKSLSFAVD
jgi:hypothetical protein